MSGQARPNATALVVLGPTGTGKSRVALEVARLLRGEIVGCDAYQVYRGLDVATGKPPAEFRRALPHHLVDHVDPRTDFSMADYVRAAEQAITAIAGRGRVPLVVGGNGLYLRGLLRGVIEAPPRDPQLRARLHRIIEKGGAPRLWTWLGRRDPDTARRLRPGDMQRLVRAIELACGDGANWSERLQQAGTWSSGQERYRTLKIGLDMARELHHERIDTRVDGFFAAGLVAEVEELLRRGVPREANAFKAIGYREVLRALQVGTDPESVRDEVRRNTRRYAKRQRTWFRAEPGTVWLDAADEPSAIGRRVVDLWRELECTDGRSNCVSRR